MSTGVWPTRFIAMMKEFIQAAEKCRSTLGLTIHNNT
jgi:hypothetical protein